MAKRRLLTWILLLVFTLVAGVVSGKAIDYAIVVILALSVLKFMGVAFEFMDLKTAHRFWKIALISFLTVFIGIVLIVF